MLVSISIHTERFLIIKMKYKTLTPTWFVILSLVLYLYEMLIGILHIHISYLLYLYPMYLFCILCAVMLIIFIVNKTELLGIIIAAIPVTSILVIIIEAIVMMINNFDPSSSTFTIVWWYIEFFSMIILTSHMLLRKTNPLSMKKVLNKKRDEKKRKRYLFGKFYLGIMILDAVLNLLLLLLYYILYPRISDGVVSTSTVIELFLCLLSVAFIIYVLITRINKIQLILPILFLTVFIACTSDASKLIAQGINPMDLRYMHNIITDIIVIVVYLFIICFSLYWLKKDKYNASRIK